MPPIASDGHRARAGGAWTVKKLTYLRKYAKAFMVAMAPKRGEGKWKRLLFIDLLCGPGLDIIDGVEHHGSPLIALETEPLFDMLFLGDADEANIAALRTRIPPDHAARIDLVSADCHARARSVIDQVSNWGELGFAFIDPEGFEVRFELFEILSKRPIDILFLFPSGIGIKRNLSQFARQPADTLMDGLLGDREWRQLPLAKLLSGATLTLSEAEQLDLSWVAEFQRRVEALGYSYHGSSPLLRNDQNVPMYHLLFFSKSQAGLDIWRGIGRIEPGGQRRLW